MNLSLERITHLLCDAGVHDLVFSASFQVSELQSSQKLCVHNRECNYCPRFYLFAGRPGAVGRPTERVRWCATRVGSENSLRSCSQENPDQIQGPIRGSSALVRLTIHGTSRATARNNCVLGLLPSFQRHNPRKLLDEAKVFAVHKPPRLDHCTIRFGHILCLH